MTSSSRTGNSKACLVNNSHLSSACRPHSLACTGPASSMTVMRQAPSSACSLFKLHFLSWDCLLLIHITPFPPCPCSVCLVLHRPVITDSPRAPLEAPVKTHEDCIQWLSQGPRTLCRKSIGAVAMKALHQRGLDRVGTELIVNVPCM